MGNKSKIQQLIDENDLDLSCDIIDPRQSVEKTEEYSKIIYEKRKRKGVTPSNAKSLARERNYFGCLMVECGEADAFISGLTNNYSSAIRPALQIIGMEKDRKKWPGCTSS